MSKKMVKVSKFLSLVLRHQPERIGLAVDSQGWADVTELLTKAQEAGMAIDADVLREVVATNNKKRFAFNEDGSRIRASQGHSIAVDLGLEVIEPPTILYHGTAARFLPSIQEAGLLSRRRNHVHLSGDEETAVSVGKRHGKPVVLRVRAGEMAQQGLAVYRSENGVWLTEHVPVVYIEFPS